MSYAYTIMKVNLAAVAKDVSFKDAREISKWAKTAVAACWTAGFFVGSNGYFYPKRKATRAAVAQILMQFDKTNG